MIRQEQANFTEISDALGYTSIHYFSRQFKTFTGMSPSEYALSIKALSEEDAANGPALICGRATVHSFRYCPLRTQ